MRVVQPPRLVAQQIEHHRQGVGRVAVVVDHQRAARRRVRSRDGRRRQFRIAIVGDHAGHAAGKGHPELRALSQARTAHADPPAVHLHELLHQGQADAQASTRAFDRGVHLRPEVEDAVHLFRGEADAAVAHADVDVVAFHRGDHVDPSARIRILRRVVEQVGEQLRETLLVDQQLHRFVGHLEHQFVPTGVDQRRGGLHRRLQH